MKNMASIVAISSLLFLTFSPSSFAAISQGNGVLSVAELLATVGIKPAAGEHWRVNGESNTNDRTCYQDGALFTYAFDNDQEHAVKISSEKMPLSDADNAKACNGQSSIVQLEAIKDGQISKLIDIKVPLDSPTHFIASFTALPTPKPKSTITLSLSDVLHRLNINQSHWEIVSSSSTKNTSCDFNGIRYTYQVGTDATKLFSIKKTVLLNDEKPAVSCFNKIVILHLKSLKDNTAPETINMTIQLNPYKKLKTNYIKTTNSGVKKGDVTLIQ